MSSTGASDAPVDNTLPITRLLDSELMEIMEALDAIDYAVERWMENVEDASAASGKPFASRKALSILGCSKHIMKKALRILAALMDPDAWDEAHHYKAHNYLEFFFRMLRSEERMVRKRYSIYRDGFPPIEAVHSMMDCSWPMRCRCRLRTKYAPYRETLLLAERLPLPRAVTFRRNRCGNTFSGNGFRLVPRQRIAQSATHRKPCACGSPSAIFFVFLRRFDAAPQHRRYP